MILTAASRITSPMILASIVPASILPVLLVLVRLISLASSSVCERRLTAIMSPLALTVIEPLKLSTLVSSMALLSSMLMSPAALVEIFALVTVVSKSIAPSAAAVRTSARIAVAALPSSVIAPAEFSITSPCSPASIVPTRIASNVVVKMMSLASASVSDRTSIAVIESSAVTEIDPLSLVILVKAIESSSMIEIELPAPAVKPNTFVDRLISPPAVTERSDATIWLPVTSPTVAIMVILLAMRRLMNTCAVASSINTSPLVAMSMLISPTALKTKSDKPFSVYTVSRPPSPSIISSPLALLSSTVSSPAPSFRIVVPA